MEECTRGVEIRRMWSEQEMVCAFGGHMFPGTPDGMFEAWDGTLTCVQVVRVPLTQEMCQEDMQAALAQTVITKVVKSQHWLRATHVTPFDFVVFCWLPFTVSEAVVDSAEVLMQRIQKQDPRFSLQLRVPAAAGALFPALFACNAFHSRSKSYSESDVSTYSGEDESDDDEIYAWDITWEWDSDLPAMAEEVVVAEKVEAKEEFAGSGEKQPQTVQLLDTLGESESGQCISLQTNMSKVTSIWDPGG